MTDNFLGTSGTILGTNQQTYQRLETALNLNLRHQVFVAVCDDILLRDRLVAHLQTALSPATVRGNKTGQEQSYPRLVSLHLDLHDPSPIAQVAQWLRQFPPPKRGNWRAPMPMFQILGIEKIARQPATVQRIFLTHLQAIEQSLPFLESGLLLWLTQPWFQTLPEAVPEFWRCRTGIFEFAGDPTPLSSIAPERIETRQPIRTATETSQRSTDTHEATDIDDQISTAAIDLAENPWLVLADDLTQLYETASETTPASTAATDELLPQSLSEEALIAQLLNKSWDKESLALEIESMLADQAPSIVLATAYRLLGNLYRDRLDHEPDLLPEVYQALSAYSQCLTHLPPDSSLWVDVLNDMGNLFWLLSRLTLESDAAVANLQQAIQTYQDAVALLPDQHESTARSMVQNNLGAAYADLARYQEPVENLQQSVAAYLDAARCCPAAMDAQRYASVQNNLGTAYWNLAQHEQPLAHLKQAIGAYSEAMHHYDPSKDPLHYAMIQNNLGTAYWNLSQYERPKDWLMLAVSAYGSALKYRTLAAAPAAFAATQNNLGTAYWHIANQSEDPAVCMDYLKQAIVAYNQALQATAQLSNQANQENRSAAAQVNFDVFATYNNLGLAHYQLATDFEAELDAATRSTHLTQSLQHHVTALQGWKQKPDFYQSALRSILQTVRTAYSQEGLGGQNRALSMVPADLLPELLPQL
ncbi:MAG TPA: tetratricopeptide repeat protein [Trichocoleus sp.]